MNFRISWLTRGPRGRIIANSHGWFNDMPSRAAALLKATKYAIASAEEAGHSVFNVEVSVMEET